MSARGVADRDRSNTTRDLRFRAAQLGDVPDIVDVLSEAAAWAKARGIERWWSVPFPETWVRRGVERGDVFVIELGPRVIGTLTLTRQDRLMWGDRPPEAGYLHRLAIRRDFAHQGFGKHALDWAGSLVRSWGRSKLRLDCLATNESLVRYYLGQGFKEVGRIQGNIPGEDRPSILMERDVH